MTGRLPIDHVRDAIEATGSATKNQPGGFMAQCPAHEDHNPSLSITLAKDGKVLLHCHAGCETDAVLMASKLTPNDLFPDEPERRNGSPIVATYDYHDQDGTLVYQVVRKDPKDFRQRRPDGAGGWLWNLRGVDRLPYRLPELLASSGGVFIVEGEKDADRLTGEGLTATCNAGGAGKFGANLARWFEGRDVAIVPDNDEPGRDHARQVAEVLAPVAASVRIVDPGLTGEKCDVSNWLDDGHTGEELRQIARDTRPWQPTNDDGPTDVTSGLPQPVDLRDLMTGNRPELAYIIEPIAAAGKLVGIVAKRGEGKSLLSLEMAAAAATGSACLEQDDGPPVNVIYIDMEMGPDDLYDRLHDLGYTPDHPRFEVMLDHLHYYQLPALPPLDTEAGGQMLDQLVELHGAALVIIDTVSRIISGAENDAEPFLNLFRHTETRLKRRGVALVRLDHFGKDATKGSRGHSAKEDPLDVVWEMSVAGHQVTLNRTKGRQAGTPTTLSLIRSDEDGRLTHRLPDNPIITPKAAEVVDQLDGLNLPADVSVRAAQDALRSIDAGRSKAAIVEAVRWRKSRKKRFWNRSEEPEHGTIPGTTPEPPRTAENRPSEPRVPPKEGTGVRGRQSDPIETSRQVPPDERPGAA